jgi:plastocyanin
VAAAGIWWATTQFNGTTTLTNTLGNNTLSNNALIPTPGISTGKVAIVNYTATGFSPNQITIQAGTTVKFVNQSDADFWPASNPHPIHTGLWGFDAKQPIVPGESYEFTFTKTGNFGFHNHLQISNTGKIIVQ